MKKALSLQINKLKKAPGFKPMGRHVAQYSVVFEEKEKLEVVYNQNTACHAGLRDLSYIYNPITGRYEGVGGTPIAIFNSIENLNVDEKVAERFLEWFFNYSPYHTAWVSKSAKLVLKSKVMVGDCEAPANILGGAMFASRSLWEHGARVAKFWNAFVERGCHPDIAFMIAHHFITDGTTVSVNPISWHVAIDGTYVNGNNILNFITKNVRDDKPYKEKKGYDNIHATWTKQNPDAKGIEVPHSEWLKQVGVDEKKAVNVFKKGPAVVIRLEAAAEALSPKYNEAFKKWIK